MLEFAKQKCLVLMYGINENSFVSPSHPVCKRGKRLFSSFHDLFLQCFLVDLQLVSLLQWPFKKCFSVSKRVMLVDFNDAMSIHQGLNLSHRHRLALMVWCGDRYCESDVLEIETSHPFASWYVGAWSACKIPSLEVVRDSWGC